MKINIVKKIKEGDPDYDAIGEPFYYRVRIVGRYSPNLAINDVVDYYPPDPNDDLDQVNLGVVPKLYGRLGNELYYDMLKQICKNVNMWESMKEGGLNDDQINTAMKI